MDDPALDPQRHHAALDGLARLNRISHSADLVWRAIHDLAPRVDRRDNDDDRAGNSDASPAAPLRVLDVATGGGDVPIALHRLARRDGRAVSLAACDISDVALEHARRAADADGAPIDLFAHDAVRDPLPDGYDVVTCSLFLHHLEHDDAITLLGRMRDAARRRVVVNDLQRSRLNLTLVWLGSRLVSRCDVVHVDGPRSVRAALTIDEARRYAAEAGLPDARVAASFPCRYLMTWDRPR